jgi:AbrB family looped-hinge helix DNA binding protein
MKNTNKWSLHKKIHERFQKHDKFYGTTTMGARGQVVIPAGARKELGLKPGDQLVVMGKFGKVLGLMKTDAMAGFVETIMKNLEGTGMEGLAKQHMEKMFGKIKNPFRT